MIPTISLHGGGESMVLANRGPGNLLTRGATGLGMAPAELTIADLSGGGGVLRHRRQTVPDVMIPMLLGGDYGQRWEARRRLERMMQGEVEVRVTQPDGGSRSRFGYYKDGLEGSYGAGEGAHDGQTLALTFTCPDPRWFGVERSEVWGLSPARTAWLTSLRDEPSKPQLVRTNYVLNPSVVGDFGRATFEGGDYQSVNSGDSTENAWHGDTSWRFEVTGTDGDRIGGRLDTGASGTMRYAAGVWVNPRPGVATVTVQIQALQDGRWVATSSTTHTAVNTGWSQYTTEEESAQWGERRLVFYLRGGSGSGGWFSPGPIPVGTVHFVDAASLVPADESVAHFNGDMQVEGYTTNWTGVPNESTSQRWTIPEEGDDMLSVPFGVMRISESTVQGARSIEISGDAPAEARFVVTGPGEDLEIINESTGERVFIEGDIFEPVTIDGRRGRGDIYSDSRQDGQWWAQVNEDAPLGLISLVPGNNRIRVTMVSAHPQSSVELLYQETFHAGH